MPDTTAYVEHVAIPVANMLEYIAFFKDVLGMTVTKLDGDADHPRQVWLLGGVQLVHVPDFAGPEGRCAHLGIVCADVEAAIAGTRRHGGVSTDKGPNWLKMPDGLYLEFMSQKGNSVAVAHQNDPRRAV